MKELIQHLKTRGNMYLFDETYTSLVSFISGYAYGRSEGDGINVDRAFQSWMRAKYNKEFSIHWSHYILSELASDDPRRAKELVLELYEEFARFLESSVLGS